MADRERQRLIFAHQEWLGFVQPVGLVVSPPVMVDAQVVPDRNVSGRQREFITLLERDDTGATARWRAPDLRRLFLDWLGWDEADLADADTDRERLEIALPELHAVLAPTWAVPADGGNEGGEAADIGNGEAAGHGHKEAASHGAGESAGNSDRESAGSDDGKAAGWQMLIRVEPDGADLDAPPADAAWNASRHERFVRLLSETGVPAGLLCTDDRIRLIHAPGGETPGYLTFDFSQMAMPAGRPILAAFDMLLSAGAMFMNAEEARLPALLARSREAQAEVSTRLARQVLAALYELLRGFVAADAHRGALPALARESPDHLYSGLIVVLMRLVFLLYTEDRGMMPGHPVYQQHYSLGGLFARLRADAAAWPDTMDQRFGAWAQLLSLFRLVYGGGRHGNLSFVARKGRLFDPARFPFLERLPPSKRSGAVEAAEAGMAEEGEILPGQPPARSPSVHDPSPEAGSAEETAVPPAPDSNGRRRAEVEADIPLVPDRTVWRVLENLVMLDGERLSYRTLDVEQIGSVYEAIMGFRIELTAGRSIAVRSRQRTGAAVVIDLDALLSLDPGKRAKGVAERTDHKLTGKAEAALRQAGTVEDAVAALEGRIDRDATPDVVPAHTPVLQPTDERRRSGSHYTPSTLTGPIVADALRPLFGHLGPSPAPDRILDLKILDPAMGSGAFLVEACRQLARKLVEAWHAHGGPPAIPPDEDELLHARRLVAQHCLYGVDKNAMAVDLARLSLWLVTFAKDHEFTFINHALRHGDSLTGLSLAQIQALHWREDIPPQMEMEEEAVRRSVAKARELRTRIHAAGEGATTDELDDLLDRAKSELSDAKACGDLVLLAFFKGKKPAEREQIRKEHAACVLADGEDRYRDEIETWRNADPPFAPFHWEIEFPEVFERENPGFDAVVGNPPFAGKNTVIAAHVAGYLHWLKAMHQGSHGNADLVAHFFRRAFALMRGNGAFGLIATNTIAQGDTRATGLRFICENGGEIYRARRRLKWPGLAAVVVSVLHVAKSSFPVATAKRLDGEAASDHGAGILSAGLLPGAKRLDGEAAPGHRPATLPAGSFPGTKRLDGQAVETITAFLFHRGGHADPARLATNAGRSFQGSIVLGMGFTFDDTDRKGVASPLAEMRRLMEKDSRNREVIFPYIGGEEVNTSPTHAHHRYVINFRDWPLRREDGGQLQADIGRVWEDAGELREDIGGSRQGVGELRADADDQRRRHPSRREDGGESEGVGKSWAEVDDRRRRYPSHREDIGESEGVGEAWTDAGDRRRRYPLHREDGGESWADADEKRRRELRRQPIVPHDYPEPVAADWPDLLAIVEEKVKPERLREKRETRRKRWWQFGDRQPALQTAIDGLERVLVISRVSEHAGIGFLRSGAVYSDRLIVFPFETFSVFGVLQSRPHETWARFFGSSLEDRLTYTPSDCFETFPFPEGWETHPALEAAGRAYHDFRAALMVRNNEGMTRIYNRFHDPDETNETDPDITELRALHTAMDRAVLDAYGWNDIPTDCEFLPDYVIDDEEWGRRKKPYRYRWPDAIRDEVLARLLALNAERAEAERAAADHE